MAIVKAIKDSTSTSQLKYLLTEYLIKKEKVLNRITKGINISDNMNSAYLDMMLTKEKHDKLTGRQYKHYCISFSHDESKQLGADTIMNFSEEVVRRMTMPDGTPLSNFEIALVTHEDREHIHTHIVINSVNPETGKKFNVPESFLEKFKQECNKLSLENELSVPFKKQFEAKKKKTTNNYNENIYNKKKGKLEQKREKVAKDIEEIAKITKNKYMFGKEMYKRGYIVAWKDDYKKENKTLMDIGNITIIDTKSNPNKTKQDHYRLDTLLKAIEIDISHNTDLTKWYEQITEKTNRLQYIRELRNQKIEIKQEDIIINQRFTDEYNNIKKGVDSLNSKLFIKPTELPDKVKKDIDILAKDIFNNNIEMQQILDKKIEEIQKTKKELGIELTQKEINSMKDQFIYAIEQEILNDIKQKKYLKNYEFKQIARTGMKFFLKQLIRSMKNKPIKPDTNDSKKDDYMKKLRESKALEY